ncbi:unnamed protein product [Paramecium sonneborni]|uniref:Uncharacterized protein n=1 Tax=Paramecium sonneborni TaxID=65129 RepID=A0A8S1MV79_9CILI|nr:unnamed protein product [Paramecium sonneborni]CAD8084228.1 unnamed protein product [Paramecium sonneborni]
MGMSQLNQHQIFMQQAVKVSQVYEQRLQESFRQGDVRALFINLQSQIQQIVNSKYMKAKKIYSSQKTKKQLKERSLLIYY